MATVRLPQDFPEWRYCIEVLCKTPLTESYVDQRIVDLTGLTKKLDRQFVELYGEPHRQQVLAWFQRVKEEGCYS